MYVGVSGLTFRTLGCRRQGHAGSWFRAAVTSGVSTAAKELQSAFTDWTSRSTCSGSSTLTDDQERKQVQLFVLGPNASLTVQGDTRGYAGMRGRFNVLQC